ncbi:MAG: SLC13 family permease [Cryomorphaceae bacterium]|nr:SLC13 family permease [Cryomorphaceae bacterium]
MIATAIVTVIIIALLLWDRFEASLVFMGGAVAMVLLGAVRVEDFLQSFSNKAVITIFLLIYLTATIHEHFPLMAKLDKAFGKSKSPRAFIFKMTSSVSLFSSVMNNTPIVALFIPYVYQWGKKNNVAPSRLLIPLSYAAIFGGMITVIGTSTNLVLNGFLLSRDQAPLAFVHFLIPGLVVTAAGVLFLTLFFRRLLPEHKVNDDTKEILREYLAETKLQADSELVGKTVSEAGLRNLDGVYLAEVYQDGKLLPAVSPETMLRANDRLYFAGDTDRVVDVISKFPGIVWPKLDSLSIDDQARVIEVVVPGNSFLIGKTPKQMGFRERYDAAVVGIHRQGERVRGKLGEIELKAGDLLLLTVGHNFEKRLKQGKDMYPLQSIQDIAPKGQKSVLFLVILAVLIGLSMAGVIKFFMALILALGASVILRLFNSEDIKQNTDLNLFFILGGAITVGKGIIDSGVADVISQPLMQVMEGWSPMSILIVLYLMTIFFTSFVTNVASVAIVFPLAYTLVQHTGINPTAVYLVLAFGASAAFLTPISYQTNIMVYGPGKYVLKDFLKIGIPFTFVYSIVALTTIFLIHGI